MLQTAGVKGWFWVSCSGVGQLCLTFPTEMSGRPPGGVFSVSSADFSLKIKLPCLQMCPGPFQTPLVPFQIFRSSLSLSAVLKTILQAFCSWFDQIILQDWPPQSRSPSPLSHPDAKPQSASIPQKSIDHPGFFPGKNPGCLKIREWVYSASSGQRSQAPDPALPQRNDSDPWCIDKEFNAVLTNQFWAQDTNPIVFQPSCVQKESIPQNLFIHPL